MSRLRFALLLAMLNVLAACHQLPPDCRIGDADSQQMSTRVLFLERLNGCAVGGRH